MTTKRIIPAAVVVVAFLGLAFGLAQDADAQAAIRRFAFPAEYRGNNSGAAFTVRQDGSGSVLTVKDGATSEYTFDQSSATFVNPLSLSSTLAVTGATTHAADVTASADSTGGNAAAVTEFLGVPKLRGFIVGTMTNGAAAGKTVTGYIDETPAGEWTGTTNVTDATDSSVYRKGTAALSLAFTASAVAGNGGDNTLAGGNEDWSGDESFGFWHRCTEATTAGDLVLEITDSVAGATTVNIPALSAADTWTWTEVDISGVADASKDVVTDIALDLSSAGATAHGAFTCYFDYAYKWDATEEEAIGQNVYPDGVLSVYTVATAAGSANTPALLTEGTDYFVHYESGNDFIVTITDQSANSGWGLAAVQ